MDTSVYLVSYTINNNKSKWHTRTPTHGLAILVPRGRAPFGQHQQSRLLAWSNDIPVFNGFVNTIDWDQNQSDLRRVTGSPWIRCWTWPEVAILGADQKERGLWGRECALNSLPSSITDVYHVTSPCKWPYHVLFLISATKLDNCKWNPLEQGTYLPARF